ncbi:uncharacterized protein LOC132052631 [Lycium ferocissimum]|uniref:uncharacterized protein LOC132052631 n=1 Tax=Lycium ferocissimum TaxID=112874 RepID=UPI002814F457|nr:uncharacterized protein LOC132052631 [Lycium ferocissimum]
MVKQVGRPKEKRNMEIDEARKRKGEWSQSRKGTQMTYGNCGEPNHNARGYYRDKSTGKGSNSRKGKRPMNGNSQSTSVGDADENETATQQSVVQATTQEFEPYGLDVGIEEDPTLRPMVISESRKE